MNRLLIMIVVITAIITISKLIMNLLKIEDRKNGLNINEQNYTIKKSLFNSSDQEKRIEKLQKLYFVDFEINRNLWKRALIITLISSGAGLIIGFIIHYGIGGIILIAILSTIVYFSKQIKYLVLLDFFVIISIFLTKTINYPILAVTPAIIILNYVIFLDYNKYKRELKIDNITHNT